MRMTALLPTDWWIAGLLALLVSWAHGAHRCSAAFSQLVSSSASARRSRHASCLWSSSVSSVSSVRAGEDGYSVIRQPANWDLENDPVFDVPDSLQEESSLFQNQLDDEWWFQQQSSSAKQQQQKSTTPQQRPVEIPQTVQELDLLQRSLDTLDFPRVLEALYQECSTVPAKRLVAQASRQASARQTHGKSKPNQILELQPLMADTVQGSQQRYQAVREMEWLLTASPDNEHDNQFNYKNRLGYKESLLGRPPPFNKHGFNLDAIFAAIDQSKVLEGPELLDISVMLDALENIQLWNQGLKKLNDTTPLSSSSSFAIEDMEGQQQTSDIFSFTELPKLANAIVVNVTLQELLHKALDDKGRLSGATFPLIGRLRARVRSMKNDILATLNTLLATPSMQSKLALESGGPVYSQLSGSGRLVLPVSPKHASSVGMVHDTSRSGKTIYVEPHEIVGPTNELKQLEGELRTEEARVWRSLTLDIVSNREALETSVAVVGQLDLVLARYRLGQKIKGVVPVVRDEGVMQLQNAKHPVLLLRRANLDDVVGSDIELGMGKNQGLVLTGPNAGGKTVILKLLGLLALMARSGIPIPAADAVIGRNGHNDYYPRVDFFNPVLADIGDIQSVGGDLSTFSGHMLVCREVLTNSGRNALVLMDELGSGTDPNQGVAIAQALLEAVIETGARVAITTHYLQLKQLAASDDRFAVAGMQFVNGRPTYKLLPGTVGESFALSVAERLGLPKNVLERANELLDSETRAMGDLLREMEDQKALVDQQAEEMELKRKELAAMELKMKEEMIRLEKKQLDVRRQEARKFAKVLEEKEAVLESVLERLKADPTRRVVAKSWDEIRFVKRDALNEAENVPSVVARKQKVDAVVNEVSAELVPIAEMREKPVLQCGDKLVVCKKGPLFAREAVLTKIMGTRVEVQVNNMKLVLNLSQLALPTGKNYVLPSQTDESHGSQRGVSRKTIRSKAAERAIAAEGKTKSAYVGNANMDGASQPSSSSMAMRMESNTVDVRGMNLSEAQAKVKDKFSSCLMSGRPVVFILHGHGTGGVLKSKIRTWLKSEKLVKNFGAAELSDGGDAFTRVDLR